MVSMGLGSNLIMVSNWQYTNLIGMESTFQCECLLQDCDRIGIGKLH
jgi:hypothetical protein